MSYRSRQQAFESSKSSSLSKASSKGKTPKPPKPPKKHWFSRLFLAVLQLVIVVFLIAMAYVYYLSTTIPEFHSILDERSQGSVTFVDRYGEEFAWRGNQYDEIVNSQDVSTALRAAVIATEDRNFYRHFGVSIRGLTRALWLNYQNSGNPFRGQGASTITSQVAKLICLGEPYDPKLQKYAEYEAECRRPTLERKLQEIPYSLALEWKFTKDEILSIYLNRAYLGAGTYGFGAASRRYFARSAADLDIAQSAMLAGMLTAPSRYAPTNNLERSQDRSKTVMRLMYEQGYITKEQMEAAQAAPATLSATAQSDLGLYFADWLMKSEPDFLTTQTSEDIVYFTSFDPYIQKNLDQAVDKVTAQFSPTSKAQVASIIMDKSGAVLAIYGGRFDENKVELGFNRATDARRQPGSAFKPFVYGAALKRGMHPYDVFIDSEICVNVPRQGAWCPKNYSQNYKGPITMIEAMQHSVNTVAVELSENAPREKVREFARHLGITSELVDGPSLALGTSEMPLIELTTAYVGILNGTRPVSPYGWWRIANKKDQSVVADNAPYLGEAWLNEEQAGWLIYMMYNVVENGTAQRAQIPNHQIAGKTGTTSDAKDALFVGFSANYVMGVWLGYDDNSPLKGTTGGQFPADIFHEAMGAILANEPAEPLPMRIPQPIASAPQPAQPQPQGNEIDLIDNLLNLIF